MELLLMRHGKALDVGAPGVRRDAERSLSEEGHAIVREVAAVVRAMGMRPDLILSSPLVRAAQTAEIVAKEMGTTTELCPALAPGCPPHDAVEAICHRRHPCLMAVGHMPDLSELASFLIAGNGGAAITFRKAGVCLIRFEGRPREGAGSLEWLMPPRLWRHLQHG